MLTLDEVPVAVRAEPLLKVRVWVSMLTGPAPVYGLVGLGIKSDSTVSGPAAAELNNVVPGVGLV